MTPEDEIRKAGKAREILDNEIFKEACGAIKEALEHGRLNSAATDTAFREKLYAQELALHSILTNLRTYIESGELAAEEIRRRSMIDHFKEFIS